MPVSSFNSFIAETIVQQQRFDDCRDFCACARSSPSIFPCGATFLIKDLQRLAGESVAILGRAQADLVRAELDQMIFERRLVFQIAFLLAAFDFVERRLGDNRCPCSTRSGIWR